MTATHDATTTIRDPENDRYRSIVDQDLNRFAELSHPDVAYSHSSGDTDSLETS